MNDKKRNLYPKCLKLLDWFPAVAIYQFYVYYLRLVHNK